MGCKLFLSKNEIRIVPPKRLRRVKNIKTMPYPGFPTDCQSVLMAVLSKANGTSVFNESVFEGRYKHISDTVAALPVPVARVKRVTLPHIRQKNKSIDKSL